MSLDDLRDDMKRNLAEAKRCGSVQELKAHIVDTLWPWLEAQLEVVEEIDDAVGELVDRTEDYLQAETAAIFATLVSTSLEISGELRKRAAGDDLLLKRLDAYDQLCAQAMATLGQITMIDPDADEGEDGDEDEEAGGANA